MHKISLLMLVMVSFLLSACLPGEGIQAPAGRFVGLDKATYLGIPYAEPPLGNLRWRAPRLKAPMDPKVPYLASFKRPGCLQGNGFTGVFVTNEDCLYLNIWRPKVFSGQLPVMVYIHGDSADIGSGGEAQYEGRYLADTYGVIVITINARLGIMGFLSIDDFEAEGLADEGVRHAGNYNFLDHLKALEWVNTNISAFGGDPNNVTLFGESAGAIATCYHIASPLSTSKGYFKRGIIQSGHCEFATRSQTLANSQGMSFAKNVLGCSPQTRAGDGTTASCLRAKSGPTLYQLEKLANPNGNALSFDRLLPLLNAVNDGYFIQGATVRESIQSHSNTSIPVIIGSNLNEGTLLNAFSVPTIYSQADYENYASEWFGADKVDDITSLYPMSNYPSAIDAVSDVQGDMIFPCGVRRTADTLQERGHTVYQYELRQEMEPPFLSTYVLTYNKGKGPELGVFHSSDIPFVFGTKSVLGDAHWPKSRQTMVIMQEYWTSFAKTGIPTSTTAKSLGINVWPKYISPDKGGTRRYLAFQNQPVIGSQLRKQKCDYWQANILSNYFDAYP